ncbi:trace amine-associated receptor 13c-like [Sardina pilchardus]|uniref:trace amine-associated receptor 13c-like n=1 Tax=Sardina pilchardus TaxID=27697 RepID=UPI002E106C8E
MKQQTLIRNVSCVENESCVGALCFFIALAICSLNSDSVPLHNREDGKRGGALSCLISIDVLDEVDMSIGELGETIGNVLYFGECHLDPNGLWASIDLFLVFILPCSVILLSYMKIFLIARKHSKGIKLAKGNTTTRNRKYGDGVPNASERKAATTLGILVIVFLACLLPYFLSILFSAFIPGTLMKVLAGTLPLLYLNSAINPLVYALFYPWFRKCAKLIFMLSIFNTDSSLVNVLTNSG